MTRPSPWFFARLRIAALSLAGAFVSISGPASAQEITILDGRRVLAVSAEAYGFAPPDTAQVYVGVTAQQPDASGALDAMGASVDSVLEELALLGIADADIQTNQLTLDQAFDYGGDGNPRPEGFVATTNLVVTLRDIDQLGVLLDRVVDGGANRLTNITFSVADSRSVFDMARRAAVTEAERRAGVLADAAGVRLGEVIAISETTNFGFQGFAIEQAARDVPVATGTIALSAGVRMTFEILE